MAQLAADYAPDCPLTPVDDYLYWACIGTAERLGGPARAEGSAALQARVRHISQGWGPRFANGVSWRIPSLSVRAVQVTKAMPVWHSERIAARRRRACQRARRGLGANTALADAASPGDASGAGRQRRAGTQGLWCRSANAGRRRYAFHARRPNGCSKTVTPATQRHDRHSIISTTSSRAFYQRPLPITPAAQHIQRQHRHRLLPQP